MKRPHTTECLARPSHTMLRVSFAPWDSIIFLLFCNAFQLTTSTGLQYKELVSTPPSAKGSTSSLEVSLLSQSAPSPSIAFQAGPAPGPAPGGPPLPPITVDTCNTLIGAVKARSCKLYNFGTHLGNGCSCFLDGSICPPVPDAEKMGFTGSAVSGGQISKAEMGGFHRVTCFYRQWPEDPASKGAFLKWQEQKADIRTKNYMTSTYERADVRAEQASMSMYLLTPTPWLVLFPTTAPPTFTAGPPAYAPGAAPAR